VGGVLNAERDSAAAGEGEVSPFAAGLRSRCPRCGRGRLYQGLIKVRPRCEACGLDLSAQDSGDGPAAFLILILGAVVVPVAIWFEFAFSPPLWAHLLIWPPIVIGGTIALLRPLKATLIALQYRYRRQDYAP
jgi:uncharacterized protein (DUF983 family)